MNNKRGLRRPILNILPGIFKKSHRGCCFY
jgi:hypothetical protein